MAITNGALAVKIRDLIDSSRRRQEEFQAWLNGAADGGDASDGQFPMTDLQGNSTLVKSPARLQADVDGTVNTAEAHKDAAEAAKLSAEAASGLSAVAKNQAAAEKALAETARLAAETAQAVAENKAAIALGARTITESTSAPSGSASAGDIHLERSDTAGWQTCTVHVYVE